MSKILLVGLMLTLITSTYRSAVAQNLNQDCVCTTVSYQPLVVSSQADQYYPACAQSIGSIPLASYQTPAVTLVQYNRSNNYRRLSYQPASRFNYSNQRYLYPKADHRRYDYH